MKHFKSVLTFCLLVLFSFQSCQKNPCESVVCLNGGICNNGSCQCPSGYSGAQCQNFDPCANITCLNGGTCANGTCNCPTGYSGSDCGTLLTPISLTITRVDVLNYPVTNTSGGGWDVSTGADPFLSFSLGTSTSVNDGISGYDSDVTGGALYYTLTTTKTITNLSNYWTIGLWDYDTPDPSDFMGGIYFTPNSYKTGFPSTFTVSNSTFSFKFYVTWNF